MGIFDSKATKEKKQKAEAIVKLVDTQPDIGQAFQIYDQEAVDYLIADLNTKFLSNKFRNNANVADPARQQLAKLKLLRDMKKVQDDLVATPPSSDSLIKLGLRSDMDASRQQYMLQALIKDHPNKKLLAEAKMELAKRLPNSSQYLRQQLPKEAAEAFAELGMLPQCQEALTAQIQAGIRYRNLAERLVSDANQQDQTNPKMQTMMTAIVTLKPIKGDYDTESPEHRRRNFTDIKNAETRMAVLEMISAHQDLAHNADVAAMLIDFCSRGAVDMGRNARSHHSYDDIPEEKAKALAMLIDPEKFDLLADEADQRLGPDIQGHSVVKQFHNAIKGTESYASKVLMPDLPTFERYLKGYNAFQMTKSDTFIPVTIGTWLKPTNQSRDAFNTRVHLARLLMAGKDQVTPEEFKETVATTVSNLLGAALMDKTVTGPTERKVAGDLLKQLIMVENADKILPANRLAKMKANDLNTLETNVPQATMPPQPVYEGMGYGILQLIKGQAMDIGRHGAEIEEDLQQTVDADFVKTYPMPEKPLF